jgi:hypothetical protein
MMQSDENMSRHDASWRHYARKCQLSAEPWLHKIGKKPHRTVNDHKQQLHEYFQGKLKYHNIIL